MDRYQQNQLLNNTGKIEEMLVDFQRRRPTTLTSRERTWRSWTLIGTWVFTWIINWTGATTVMLSTGRVRGQSRLYLLRRLRSFGVQGALLKTFYDSVVAMLEQQFISSLEEEVG